MPLGRLCKHGTLYLTDKARECPACGAAARADNERRSAKDRDQRRTTKSWRRMRHRVLERDGYACRLRLPGCTGRATSVHLDPRLAGDHAAATDDDCVSACARCHGRVDGPRARGGGCAS